MKKPGSSIPHNRRPNRCIDCFMLKALCVCAELSPLDVQTKLILVMHCKENNMTTNTGRLAVRKLKNSKLYLRGARDQPFELSKDQLDLDNTFVLFPSSASQVLTPEWVIGRKKPITLIVPDGSWSQATRMYRRDKVLNSLPTVTLISQGESQYQLRKINEATRVCTLEAIARAFEILEGSVNGPVVRRELERVFKIFVDRVLYSRGQKNINQVYGGIPHA
jgi:DTW domain-containing protein YfiP